MHHGIGHMVTGGGGPVLGERWSNRGGGVVDVNPQDKVTSPQDWTTSPPKDQITSPQVWSISRRYASYWNAFLFRIVDDLFMVGVLQ